MSPIVAQGTLPAGTIRHTFKRVAGLIRLCMHRLRFNVTASVLAVFTLVGFGVTVLRPMIPPGKTNERLVDTGEEFLVRGAREEVAWRPLNASTVAEARRIGKPILLLIGVPGSEVAWHMDADVFTDMDVAKFMNWNFTNIRVDGLQHPEWLNAFFPLTRFTADIQPRFQIWILDRTGKVVEALAHPPARQSFDRDSFLNTLEQTEHAMGTFAYSELTESGYSQRFDFERLNSSATDQPVSTSRYVTSLASYIGKPGGGFPRFAQQFLYPNAWKCLCLLGDDGPLRESLDPVLLSPMMDLQNGGFFSPANQDLRTVTFAKSLMENAEMLEVLALANALYPDPLYQYAAKLDFMFLEEMMFRDGRMAAFSLSHPVRDGRSPRYSYSLARMRDVLTPDQRDWASKFLGLRVMSNPQMIPYLTSRETLEQPDLRQVMTGLRASTVAGIELSGAGVCEVEALTAAKMISAGRIAGNSVWIDEGLRRASGLKRFRTGLDLYHCLRAGDYQRGYLGDYLSYADARLQQFLATGDESALREGRTLLSRTLTLFAGSQRGEYLLSATKPLLPDTWVSELADNLRESCTARVARLCMDYGRLLSGTSDGASLVQRARDALDQSAHAAGDGGPLTGGYFCAAAVSEDATYALCVGPGALEDSLTLQHLRPTRLVAPAVGDARKAVSGQGSGVYVIGKKVEGPFTVEQAAVRLPMFLSSAQPSP